MTSPLVAIVGPTASGKSDLALALARRLPIEILVADSRQVYRGMDIGTAKPDATARAAVPHHLLDLADPDQPFSVADWVERARVLVPEILARGQLPLVVGGTGLYVAALVDGHDYASQPWSPAVRRRISEEFEADGLEPLVRRLRQLDPATAHRIDLHNPRRVVRALERVEAGGSGGEVPAASAWSGPLRLIGLDRPRAELYRRTDDRARGFFENGLIDEVRGLQAAGYGRELRPMTGHGYREAAAVIAGEWDVERATAETARRTRQYAKRQLTWFRADPRVQWISVGDAPADAERIVEQAEALAREVLAG